MSDLTPHDFPHVIRLRGPWHYQPLARTVMTAAGESCEETGSLPAAGRANMPADWGPTLGADFRGRVAYRRRFNRPNGLTDETEVHLVLEQIDAWASVELNGQPLGEVRWDECPARFDVTRRLQTHNELTIVVELPRLAPDSAPLPRGARDGLPGGLVGEVRLEIFD